VFNVPKNGIVVFGGDDPFRSYLCTARFANGDPIWVFGRLGDHAEKGQVGLFGGSTHRKWQGTLSENDGKLVPVGEQEYHIFVGTEEQWKSGKRRGSWDVIDGDAWR
jgi:hypothetical protein